VPLRISRLSTCEKPDADGADDGGKSKSETDSAEKFELRWFHHSTWNRSRSAKMARFFLKISEEPTFW
jgi:hypothetical protein